MSDSPQHRGAVANRNNHKCAFAAVRNAATQNRASPLYVIYSVSELFGLDYTQGATPDLQTARESDYAMTHADSVKFNQSFFAPASIHAAISATCSAVRALPDDGMVSPHGADVPLVFAFTFCHRRLLAWLPATTRVLPEPPHCEPAATTPTKLA